eukprot:3423846-Amphidinium_carterae.1
MAPQPSMPANTVGMHRPGESAGSTSVLIRTGQEPQPLAHVGPQGWETSGPVTLDIVDISDSDDAAAAVPRVHTEQLVADETDLVPKVKRRRWALDKLPEHIIAHENDFALRYRCLRCGCMNAAQSRSSFFAKHWECSGEAVLRTTNRHFVRKALLPENKGRKPSAEEVLDPDWYQTYGILPICIAQPVPLIHCTVCAVRDRQCNRKKFIKTHLNCLSEAIHWHNNGSFSFLDGVLHRGAKKRKQPVTFDEASDTLLQPTFVD